MDAANETQPSTDITTNIDDIFKAEPEGKVLTAADIFGADDREYVYVPMPEWNGSVRMTTMSAQEAIKWVEALQGPGVKAANIRIVVKCAVDDKGNKLFTEQQIEQLSKKSIKLVNRLANVALKLNGLTKEAQEAEKNA